MANFYAQYTTSALLKELDDMGDGHLLIHAAAARIRELEAAQHRVERTVCQHCEADVIVEYICTNLNCDGGINRRSR